MATEKKEIPQVYQLSKKPRYVEFGQRVSKRREELELTQAELAKRLGMSTSAVGNYEAGISFPRDSVIVKLMDCLEVDANYIYGTTTDKNILCYNEQVMMNKYRLLPPEQKNVVNMMVDTLHQNLMDAPPVLTPVREIPLYLCPAAAGYASPVYGDDFESIRVEGDVPMAAVCAIRIEGDSMEPVIPDGAIVYVSLDPVYDGDIGIFSVDGDAYCKQYYKDPTGTIYLFSLNRNRADADIVLPASSGQSIYRVGRVMMKSQPLPGNRPIGL